MRVKDRPGVCHEELGGRRPLYRTGSASGHLGLEAWEDGLSLHILSFPSVRWAVAPVMRNTEHLEQCLAHNNTA